MCKHYMCKLRKAWLTSKENTKLNFERKRFTAIYLLYQVNHRKYMYMTPQSNGIVAVQDRKILHGCLALKIAVLHR
jgi:hypothetical protein